jgi:hypothetical protein
MGCPIATADLTTKTFGNNHDCCGFLCANKYALPMCTGYAGAAWISSKSAVSLNHSHVTCSQCGPRRVALS